MTIQFTEPVILLFCVGLIFSLYKLGKKTFHLERFLIVLLWFFVPFTYFIFGKTTLYHNFRQVLFIIPPIFFLAGLGILSLLELLRNKVMFPILAALVLIPGIFHLVRLHPYQYIYYNAFIGGTENASRYFETDYWDLAFRQMALDVNEVVPPFSIVVGWGAPESIEPFLKNNILFVSNVDYFYTIINHFDYAVLDSRSIRKTPPLYQGAPVLRTVVREGATLAELKKVEGFTP
jgi:hypothetical protein